MILSQEPRKTPSCSKSRKTPPFCRSAKWSPNELTNNAYKSGELRLHANMYNHKYPPCISKTKTNLDLRKKFELNSTLSNFSVHFSKHK